MSSKHPPIVPQPFIVPILIKPLFGAGHCYMLDTNEDKLGIVFSHLYELCSLVEKADKNQVNRNKYKPIILSGMGFKLQNPLVSL
jgi:hypothetical protein